MTKKEQLTCYAPLPKERYDSYQKFLIYRDMLPHERSLMKVAEQLSKVNEGKQSPEKIKGALGRLSAKWGWVERAALYDADQQLKLMRKKETTFDNLSDVLLDNVEGLIKYANNLLAEVIQKPVKENGEQYSLTTRIKMIKDVSSLLYESHELLCNLCGRPSSYTNITMDTNVKYYGLEELADAFNESKQQYLERKQEEQ